MRSLLTALVLLGAGAQTLHAQTVPFGGYTYVAPAGWRVQELPGVRWHMQIVTGNRVCAVGIAESRANDVSAEADVDAVWTGWPSSAFRVSGTPVTRTNAHPRGGQAIVRSAPMRGDDGPQLVELTVLRFGARHAAVLFVALDGARRDACRPASDALIASITPGREMTAADAPALPAPAVPLAGRALPPVAQGAERVDAAGLAGTWIVSGSAHTVDGEVNAGTSGYTKGQYVFSNDGTYRFASRTFRMSMREILVVQERGRWKLTGDVLEVAPERSRIEGWTKAGGGDRNGSLGSRADRPLERATYRVSRFYFSGIQEWNLVLQAAAPTRRDGAFSGNTMYQNAWYFKVPSSNNTPIEVTD